MEHENTLVQFYRAFVYMLDTPVTFIKEKIVSPNQKKYPWYHQKFQRVPTIDECYTDDTICRTEANLQLYRDKLVDDEILTILRARYDDCIIEHSAHNDICKKINEAYKDAAAAWFTKYGDIGADMNARDVYMKQKHRMVWERRYGPVGSVPQEKIYEIIDE